MAVLINKKVTSISMENRELIQDCAVEAALECPQAELDVIIEKFRERRRLLLEGNI